MTNAKAIVLKVKTDKEQITPEEKVQRLAEAVAEPYYNSAFILDRYSLVKPQGTEAGLADLADALEKAGQQTNANNLDGLEAMLTSQAVALDAVFSKLAYTAHTALDNGGLDRAEKYLRLALKAQSQSRATVETLANMKAPRSVAFVAQANFAHGHQQVNNQTAQALTQGTPFSEQNKLITGHSHEQMDTPSQTGTERENPPLEAMGKGHRRKDPRG